MAIAKVKGFSISSLSKINGIALSAIGKIEGFDKQPSVTYEWVSFSSVNPRGQELDGDESHLWYVREGYQYLYKKDIYSGSDVATYTLSGTQISLAAHSNTEVFCNVFQNGNHYRINKSTGNIITISTSGSNRQAPVNLDILNYHYGLGSISPIVCIKKSDNTYTTISTSGGTTWGYYAEGYLWVWYYYSEYNKLVKIDINTNTVVAVYSIPIYGVGPYSYYNGYLYLFGWNMKQGYKFRISDATFIALPDAPVNLGIVTRAGETKILDNKLYVGKWDSTANNTNIYYLDLINETWGSITIPGVTAGTNWNLSSVLETGEICIDDRTNNKYIIRRKVA